MNSAPLSLPRSILVLLMLLASFLTLDSLSGRKLANPDEGRYSEIAREMAASNDFITPRLNGLKYFEKPPLQYWATAISFKLFGESEFSARLYTALCGLGCVLLMAYVGWKIFDTETGLLSALVLLSAPYFAGMTEVITLDTGLTFWMTLTMASFMLAQVALGPVLRRNWLWLAWAGMAGAVLSKGLIGILFPAATLFLYCLVQRDFRLILKLEWLAGIVIFLLGAFNLGQMLVGQDRFEEAVDLLALGSEIAMDAESWMLFALNNRPDLSTSRVFDLHMRIGNTAGAN